MAVRTVLTEEIPELTTPVIRFQIVDHEGVGFKPDVLELTLYDNRGEEIINLRDEQNVLDINQVSVDDSGNVEWLLQQLDTAIVLSDTAIETHIALFEWTWNSGTAFGKHEIEHRIRNFRQVVT